MVKLPDYRYEELKEIVVETFIRTNVNCVPVNGFEIAASLGISVCSYSSLSAKKRKKAVETDPDGFIIYDEGKWVIYYEDRTNYGRINNTIMHEIWHAVLGHKETSEVAEAEAKFCAKYSMAPPVLIYKYKTFTADMIEEYFHVSHQAAANALVYYQKWLMYGGRYYMDYEVMLCNQFGIAV